MIPSRSGTSDVSLPSWNAFEYDGPLPVWYVIACAHTRPRPHGNAVANQVTIATPPATPRSPGRFRIHDRSLAAPSVAPLRPHSHQTTGTSAGKTRGLTASAAPTST